jgi:quercetin dioxygenase-like cupin family protein
MSLKPNFKDERGTITDLLVTPEYSITHITFNKGVVRGNHYHEHTKQIDVVLKGKLQGKKTIINHTEYETGISEAILEAGNEAVHWPTEQHAYKALEYSEIISICFGVRKGADYEKDVVRLEKPLL